MNGVDDVGGMQGFGRVERDEARFHAEWETCQRALSILALRLRIFNPDEDRHAVERLHPAAYLQSGYYERWQAALELLLAEKGVLNREESALHAERSRCGHSAPLPQPASLTPNALIALPVEGAGSPTARFAPGDRVVTRNVHTTGHTRLPRYARGKHGRIESVHGVVTFPDTPAHGFGQQPQPLYGIRFEAAELWGCSAEGYSAVYLDLWEPYLQKEAS
jgi:nitrile hydratase subunit beta